MPSIPVSKLALPLLLPLLLGACSGIRTPLDGLFAAPESPDAFLVLSRAPLRMPQTLDLPAPRPGEVSPLEPTPLIDAQVALLGRPVDRAVGTGPSTGEQALLTAAGSASADPNIRTALVADADPDTQAGPYEPPSLYSFIFGDDEIEPTDVIDASAEARRLADTGVITPVDPNAVPPEPADSGTSSANTGEYPPVGNTDRRPQNTFEGY